MKTHLIVVLLSFTIAVATGCNQNFSFDLAETENEFGQNITYNNKVDILWVLDNSVSMDSHQQRLIDQVPDFIDKLNQLKLDYRIAIVTTDMGGDGNGGNFIGSPAVLDSKMSNLTSQLQARMALGEQGGNLERGLESMEMALSGDLTEGHQFLRSDALLVVNVLSNEDDKSVGTKTSSPYASHFSTFLDNSKKPWDDGSRSWMMNFIGVLGNEAGACTTFQNYSEAGLAFIELVNLSGGIKESICKASLASAMNNVKARILEVLVEFKLSRKPVESTIEVTINGVLIPSSPVNGWQYSATRNSIKFYGSAVPAADAKIKVDFKPAGAN